MDESFVFDLVGIIFVLFAMVKAAREHFSADDSFFSGSLRIFFAEFPRPGAFIESDAHHRAIDSALERLILRTHDNKSLK